MHNGYPAQGYPDPQYAAWYSQYSLAAAAPPADGPPPPAPTNLGDAIKQINALNAENSALKAEVAALKKAAGAAASPALVPPPQFYPPPAAYPGYAAYPPQYGYPPPAAAAPPPPRPASLPMNHENRRGPKGANLALFCIPNSFDDESVLDLAKPYGTPIFCSVARHRDSGMSRGYAFVSYDTLQEAEAAMSSLHNYVVEGRALRCEVARSDKDGGSKP